MDLIDALWLPAHFVLPSALKLAWEFVPREEVPWETHRGRLLEPRFCTQSRLMSAWNIIQLQDGERSSQPLLCLKLDWQSRTVHVLRGLLLYDWQVKPEAEGIVDGDEVPTWQRERVGSVDLANFDLLDDLRDELVCLLWQAVVGASRLPLTSVQAPHPLFSFGELHYLYREELQIDMRDPAAQTPMRDLSELLRVAAAQNMGWTERAKVLEFTLRATPMTDIPDLASACSQWGGGTLARLLRRMFNDVSLSPYDDFVSKTLRFVACLVDADALTLENEIDFLAHLLRQNYRHLLAYDLVVFHHRGANYPDALLLEEVLPRYLDRLTRTDSACHRGRLMALTQGCLMVHRYRDHAVPDAPTSQGENARVLPHDQPRVPAEQIEQPHLRTRLLFSGWDWKHALGDSGAKLIRTAISFLDRDRVLELGKAVFIDRPFGQGKTPLEDDQTLLLAHEAFSLALANSYLHRWRRLFRELDLALTDAEEALLKPRNLDELGVVGLGLQDFAAPSRPVPSLADAARVSGDFVVLRTLPGSVEKFQRHYATLPGLRETQLAKPRIIARIVGDSESVLALFDDDLVKIAQFEVDASKGFQGRAGLEFPLAGFIVKNDD